MSEGVQRLFWIVWPAFLVAVLLEFLVFAFVDPHDVHALSTAPLALSREAVYTLAFLVFWALACLGGALTVLLSRSPYEINRCPLAPQERPSGCPRQAQAPAAVGVAKGP